MEQLVPEELLRIAVSWRYACPACGESFAKWSACQKHVFSVCLSAAGLPDVTEDQSRNIDTEILDTLQEKCREKAEELRHVQHVFGLQ